MSNKLNYSSPVIALILLLTLGLLWGSSYSIAKFAMSNGVSPLGYAFWQSVGPAVFVTLIVYARRSSIRFSKQYLKYYLVCGLVGIACPNMIMYFAAPHLPAGILALIVNTAPTMTYPIAFAAKLEKFHWQRFLGVMFGFIGLMLILLPKTSLPAPGMLPWALLTLLTPFCFALCTIYISLARPKEADSLASSAGMMMVSGLFLTPLVLSTQNFYVISFPFNVADGVILLEIVLSSLGYVLFFELIKRAGPVYYSLVGGVVALTGLAWGYLLFGERLNLWGFLATLCIILAITLITLKFNLRSGYTAKHTVENSA